MKQKYSEVLGKHIAMHLKTKDILSLLCVNKQLHNGIGQSVTFWNELSKREGNINTNCNTTVKNNIHNCWRSAKESYLFYCVKNNPTKSGGGVKWYPVLPFGNLRLPQSRRTNGREGHLSCVLKRGKRNVCSTTSTSEENLQQQLQSGAVERTVVITGGFCDTIDDNVYLIHAGTGDTDTDTDTDAIAATATTHRRWNTERLKPIGTETDFVYGASLTALPTLYRQHQLQPQPQHQNKKEDISNICEKKISKKNANDENKKPLSSPHLSPSPPIILAEMRAVRFGGFLAGRRFSNETSQVSILSIKEVVVCDPEEPSSEPSPKARRTEFPGQFSQRRHSIQQQDQQQQGRSITSWVAEWTDISCTACARHDDDSFDNDSLVEQLARAYHSATLLFDRYLVIIGGMKATGSMRNEVILDTHTWEWIQPKQEEIIFSFPGAPPGRHGHSVVFDDTRNRLLLFGGGSGSNLLRSGIDNSEVWELRFMGGTVNNDGYLTTSNVFNSFPWCWKRLLDGDDISTNNNLSSSEQLCLGRGHNCVKISRDTVLFLFGSGRISTNRIIAYDLTTDTFIQQEPTSVTIAADTVVPTNMTATVAVSKRRHSSRLAARSSNANDTSDGSDVTDGSGGGVYVTGIVPKPKFTGVAAYLEEDGYIITHGGYCGQDLKTVGTMDVLDLAPYYRRRRQSSTTFNGLMIDEQRVSGTYEQAQQDLRDQEAALQTMLKTVMHAPREDHQRITLEMINQMHEGVHPSNRRSLLIMEGIADGNDPFFREN